MSLLASRIGFRHRCTIERNDGGGDDGFGNPEADDWQPLHEDLLCRAWTSVAREPVDQDRTAVVEDRRLAVPAGTDVTEKDRVSEVTNRGEEIFPAGPMNIVGVLQYSDHTELLLEAVR